MLSSDIASAAAANDAEDLRDALQRELAAGRTRKSLIEEITAAMLTSRANGRDQEEDLLLDALDWLTGWTSPGLKL
jgi:hypothetical protein